MKSKHIYLLVGPKGSGKSYIGSLFQKHFDISFCRVEDWIVKIEVETDYLEKDHVKKVFGLVEEGINQQLLTTDHLVFESTGLTRHFDQMLINLKAHSQVIVINIYADLETCLKRVRQRDQSIHIPLSLEVVEEINKEVIAKDIRGDYKIDNNEASEDELVNQLKSILQSTST